MNIKINQRGLYTGFILYCFLFINFSCSNHMNDGQSDIEDTRGVFIEQPVLVQTSLLEAGDFHMELIANGKLLSNEQVDLKFLIPGIIQKIFIKEGQHIKSGQVIALIDSSELITAFKQNELDLQRSIIEYEDHLLRLGYSLDDTARLDEHIIRIARLRSGLSLSEINYSKAKLHLGYSRLVAPFDGTIANLKAKEFNNTSAFEYICTLVNNEKLTVEFKVLEQELPFIKVGGYLKIAPFSTPSKSYGGAISSINPIVDNSGMITVKAQIQHDGQLLGGMGVKVIILQAIASQIFVPKEAVLDRQNRKVVFTLNDGLAKWNYVEIGYENSTHYAIESGLEEGDEVIFDGNFNLSHDRKVEKTN